MRKTPGILVFEKKNFNLRKEGEGIFFFFKTTKNNKKRLRSKEFRVKKIVKSVERVLFR